MIEEIEVTAKEVEIEFQERDIGSDVGIVYEFVDSNGDKWIQQTVAEYMIGVGYKQFGRYCKELNIDVQKHRTKRYPHKFIKEKDVERIAERFDKVLRRPWNEIPHTDENKKVLSTTDAELVAKNYVAETIVTYQNRIEKLEDRNDKLNEEIKTSGKTVYMARGQVKTWIFISVIMLLGLGALGFYYWDSQKEWGSKFSQSEKNSAALKQTLQERSFEIEKKSKEIKNLNIQIKEQEIKYLKANTTKSISIMDAFREVKGGIND